MQAMTSDEPAELGSERALGAAAEELEDLVERGDGLALLEPEDEAAPDEQAAEGDDERRHAAVRDEDALDPADQRRRRAMPTTRAMIQVYGWSKPRPRVFGIHSAWIMAIV